MTYTVASSGDAPSTLTFGPSFFDLAATYGGEVIIGLNRRLNNIANTVAAAKLAKSKMTNLDAIELGNEPNCANPKNPLPRSIKMANVSLFLVFTSSDPIANGASWTPAADYASQVAWQDQVGGNLSATNIFSAGVYFYTSPMSIQGLSAVEGNANSYVKDYCSHNYPQSASTANLASLMSHSGITSQISSFAAEVSAAKAKGKSHVMGETNSGKSYNGFFR